MMVSEEDNTTRQVTKPQPQTSQQICEGEQTQFRLQDFNIAQIQELPQKQVNYKQQTGINGTACEDSSPSNNCSSYADCITQQQLNARSVLQDQDNNESSNDRINTLNQRASTRNFRQLDQDTQNISVDEGQVGGEPEDEESNSRSRKKIKFSEQPERPKNGEQCPRCQSTNTKFCYFNNRDQKQPRYYCRSCQRFWTQGGNLRNVPPGSGRRKNKKIRSYQIETNNCNNEINNQQGIACQSNVHIQLNLQNNPTTSLPQFPHPAVVAPLLLNPLLAAHLSAQSILQLPQLVNPQQNHCSTIGPNPLQTQFTTFSNQQQNGIPGFVPYQPQNLENQRSSLTQKVGNDVTLGNVPAAVQLLLNLQLQQQQLSQQLIPATLMQQPASQNHHQQLTITENACNNNAMAWPQPLSCLHGNASDVTNLLQQYNNFSGQSQQLCEIGTNNEGDQNVCKPTPKFPPFTSPPSSDHWQYSKAVK